MSERLCVRACFNIGEKTIQQAIKKYGLKTLKKSATV